MEAIYYMPTLIYIVDGDAASRAENDNMLRASGYKTRSYGSAEEIFRQLPDDKNAGCIVIDRQARDTAPSDILDRLSKAGSGLPVIFLAEHSDIRACVNAIKAGAEDFLTKPVEPQEFLEAIDRAIARHRLTMEQEVWARAGMARLNQLTPRERQVFDRVVRAKMNKQVAFELGTTERTVKAHRQKMMEKMQVRSVAELVSCAERLGLVRPRALRVSS